MQVTIGTRGSRLALWQANWVKGVIEKIQPDCSVSLEIIKTRGDKILDVPLAKVGGKGLFVKEIEEALLDGRVDLAVHSMKDMPALLPDGTGHRSGSGTGKLPGCPDIEKQHPVGLHPTAPRGENRNQQSATVLPVAASTVRTLRNRAPAGQSGHPAPETRHHENLDAIVLAAAGIKRLGHEARDISEYLSTDIMLPAVGQGALCIEIRKDDPVMGPMAAKINHDPTRTTVLAERAFLHRLEGGCQVPIAALGSLARWPSFPDRAGGGH